MINPYFPWRGNRPEWSWEGLGTWSTEDIVDRLKTYGVEIDRERFRQAAQPYRASETLAHEFFYPQVTLPPSEEDFIWMAVLELWKRWLADRPCWEMIGERFDDLVEQETYDEDQQELQCARDVVQLLVPYLEGALQPERNAFFQTLRPYSIYHIVETLNEFVLTSLLTAKAYAEVQQVVGWLLSVEGKEEIHQDLEALLLILNGDLANGMQRYERLIKVTSEDPVYLLRAGDALTHAPCANLTRAEVFYKRAEALAQRWGQADRQGLQNQATQLRWQLYPRLIRLYQSFDQPQQVAHYESEFRSFKEELEAIKEDLENIQVPFDINPSPLIKVEKVGRNEPCPCGSGKKYKRCCGR